MNAQNPSCHCVRFRYLVKKFYPGRLNLLT